MRGVNRQQDTNGTPYSHIPPIIESGDYEYQDSGVTSTVAIAGHPIPPLLVVLPVAFLTGAAGTDLGYLLTSDSFWANRSPAWRWWLVWRRT